MDGCAAEHHARKVSLKETGRISQAGRGRTQGSLNVLQGGGPGNTNVQVVDVGRCGSNGEEDGRDAHWVP